MRRTLMVLASTSALAATSPAGASEEILRALLPVPGLQIVAMDPPEQDGGQLWITNVAASLPGSSISIGEVRIQPSPGRIEVGLDRLLWRSDSSDGLDIVTGGTLVFTGLPAATGHADALCALAGSLKEARLGRTVVEWGEGRNAAARAGARRSQIASLRLSAEPDPEVCAFNGRIDLGEAVAMLPGMSRIETRGIGLTADVPLDLEAARNAAGSARLSIGVEGLERVSGGEVPSFGAARLTLDMQAPAQRTAGVVFLLRAMASAAAAQPVEQRVMEAWNAIHLLSPQAALRAESMRLFLPGIVPTGLVANFRRAGLSNARGDLSLELSMANDRAALRGSTSLTGVFDLSLAAAAATSRIPPEVMREILADPHATAWRTSVLHLDQAQIDYLDTGMERVVGDLFGVPAGRLVEEIRDLARRDGAADPFFDRITEGLAYFLRLAAGGAEMRARFAPLTDVRVDLPGDAYDWVILEGDPSRSMRVEFSEK